jgi:lipopolysaccharide/colanic/teichoic acid biosynthesis glycosyltransferase
MNMTFVEGETTVETTTNGKVQGRRPTTRTAAISSYFAFKAWPTRIVAALLLVVAAPMIMVLVAVVRLTSAGPGLFRQTRTGRFGKEFPMYKIRTMYEDAESVSGPTWCVPGDSRITPVGKLLRLLHLDELPQLINIVRGEMDLIGPRPERPAFVDWLAREIPNYRERLQVLPGVTGLAQVNLPPDETLDCVRNKLALDCDYIRTASPGLDLRILMCTFLRMIGIRHGRAVRWFRLERQVEFAPEMSARSERVTAVRMHHPVYQTADQEYDDIHTNGVPVVAVGSTNGDGDFSAVISESVGATPLRPHRPR